MTRVRQEITASVLHAGPHFEVLAGNDTREYTLIHAGEQIGQATLNSDRPSMKRITYEWLATESWAPLNRPIDSDVVHVFNECGALPNAPTSDGLIDPGGGDFHDTRVQVACA